MITQNGALCRSPAEPVFFAARPPTLKGASRCFYTAVGLGLDARGARAVVPFDCRFGRRHFQHFFKEKNARRRRTDCAAEVCLRVAAAFCFGGGAEVEEAAAAFDAGAAG
jgi:hypothetical protein